MNAYKMETIVLFTVYDINAKCAYSKNRAKDAQMIRRIARRKNKEKLKKMLDNQDFE